MGLSFMYDILFDFEEEYDDVIWTFRDNQSYFEAVFVHEEEKKMKRMRIDFDLFEYDSSQSVPALEDSIDSSVNPLLNTIS